MKKIFTTTIALMLAISLVLAAQPVPHAFEGVIIAQDGTSTNAKTITAELNGAVTATSKIQGDSYKITVVDYTGQAGIIKFFIGEEQAYEEYTFKDFEITSTNLTFSTIPDETIGSCGDGICNANTNECSFCAIDCPVSSCNNNNVCDSAIGEDLVTSVNDCSVCGDNLCTGSETSLTCSQDCSVPSSGSSGGSSNGGSSGGSGGSSSSKITSSTTEEINETANSTSYSASILSIEELNDQENVTVEEVGRNPITGNFIRVLTTTKSKVAGFAILALVILIFFIVRKKKTKNSKKKK